ncbi:hypothetical protein Ccrd_014986, partial [Cynara cardunculus var. scolymus]
MLASRVYTEIWEQFVRVVTQQSHKRATYQRYLKPWMHFTILISSQGLMANHKEIAAYLNKKGVSIILLLRRDQLRPMISVLANSRDKNMKLLKGIHQSHVHSSQENNILSAKMATICYRNYHLSLSFMEAKILAAYKPNINATQILPTLMEKTVAFQYFNNTRHMIIYYEDIITNHTVKTVESPDQFKIHTTLFLKQIENWDEIQKALNAIEIKENYLPDVAKRLWRMQVSTPSSINNIRTKAAAKWAKTCTTPITIFLFRDTLEGTKEIAATNSNIAPTEDMYDCPTMVIPACLQLHALPYTMKVAEEHTQKDERNNVNNGERSHLRKIAPNKKKIPTMQFDLRIIIASTKSPSSHTRNKTNVPEAKEY